VAPIAFARARLHDSLCSYAFTSASCTKESESWARRHTAHLW